MSNEDLKLRYMAMSTPEREVCRTVLGKLERCGTQAEKMAALDELLSLAVDAGREAGSIPLEQYCRGLICIAESGPNTRDGVRQVLREFRARPAILQRAARMLAADALEAPVESRAELLDLLAAHFAEFIRDSKGVRE